MENQLVPADDFRTNKLAVDLSVRIKVGSDREYLKALIRALFAKYIDSYMSIEKKYLKEQCANLLQKFYESKGHQKRTIQTGGYKTPVH